MDRKFRVIQGGGGGAARQEPESLEGPVTRLGLWPRFEPSSSRVYTFLVFAKLALLASVFYYFFSK